MYVCDYVMMHKCMYVRVFVYTYPSLSLSFSLILSHSLSLHIYTIINLCRHVQYMGQSWHLVHSPQEYGQCDCNRCTNWSSIATTLPAPVP